MPSIVHVNLGCRSYDIRIGTGAAVCQGLPKSDGGTALLISDTHVAPLYGKRWEGELRRAGWNVARAIIPAGESSKCWTQVEHLCEAAARARLDRKACIVALGGGMVGDLAGFVAAVFLRGIRLVQVPTSLLAMVDSSVGGKTGINLPKGKNLVGAFHQPVAVLADLDVLDSLPEREYLSGLAEVVKYAVISDASFLQKLEKDVPALLARDKPVLARVVARCCELKARVVVRDEREERGLRASLNFGHTLAHALEKVDGYGHWLHGEAVAIGMVYALDLSVARCGLSRAERDRVVELLRRLRLPVRRGASDPGGDWAALRQAMASDKKTLQKKIHFVLTRKTGSVITGCEVPEGTLRETWHVGR